MTRKTIAILGGGVTGWSVACLLRNQLPRDLINIVLVDDVRRDNFVAEAAMSNIHDFHHLIGLSEKSCIQNSQATFGLGTSCAAGSSVNYFVAEGIYGAPLNGVNFQPIYFKSLLEGSQHKFASYSLNAVAGTLGRFGHPVPDQRSIYSSIQYGLHLELNSYTDLLKLHAHQLGVDFVVANCVAVDFDETHEKITALRLDNGESVSADLFIDCTGDASVLLGGALGVGFITENISQLFNRVAIGFRAQNSDSKSISFLETKDNYFLKIIPVKGKEIGFYTYSSESLDDLLLEERMHALAFTDVEILLADFKRRENFWVKNCIALGNSGITTCDLLVSPLTLVRNAAVRLLDLLLDFNDLTASAREYNRQTIIEYEEFKSLLELLFYFGKEHSPRLKEYFNSYPLTPAAQHRLDLFADTGRHPQTSVSILSDNEWAAIFVGNGIHPKSINLEAEAIDSESLFRFTEKLRASIYNAAQRMPTHANYIASVAITKHK